MHTRSLFFLFVALAAACGTSPASSDDAGLDATTTDASDASTDAASPSDANVPDDGTTSVDAGCGTGTLSELSATSGAVVAGTIAHAGNGDALAVWTQYDSADSGTNGALYAAEHPGCTWSAPVKIQTSFVATHPPSLVANDATFVMLEWLGGLTAPEVWTGNGMTQASGTFTDGILGTDGTTFVDVQFVGAPGYKSSTSTDGLTWTTPIVVETVGGFETIASGPAGVVAWSLDGAANVDHARVWRQGVWSAPALLSSYGTGSCVAAVGNSDALIACRGPNPDAGSPLVDVERFDGTNWQDIPPPLAGFVTTNPVLTTDGSDYRLEYGNTSTAFVLHQGAWSVAISDAAPMYGMAGRSGAWTAIRFDVNIGYSIARASGAAGLPLPTSLVAQPIPIGTWVGTDGAPFTGWPGRTDVAFVDLSGDGGVNTLYVALDL